MLKTKEKNEYLIFGLLIILIILGFVISINNSKSSGDKVIILQYAWFIMGSYSLALIYTFYQNIVSGFTAMKVYRRLTILPLVYLVPLSFAGVIVHFYERKISLETLVVLLALVYCYIIIKVRFFSKKPNQISE